MSNKAFRLYMITVTTIIFILGSITILYQIFKTEEGVYYISHVWHDESKTHIIITKGTDKSTKHIEFLGHTNINNGEWYYMKWRYKKLLISHQLYGDLNE